MIRKSLVIAALIAVAASVAAGVLGLWPDVVHGGDSTADRHEKVRLAGAINHYIKDDNWYVSRVRLNYLPHRALIQLKAYSTGRSDCAVAAQNFGDRFDREDWVGAPCDF
jgi:hypothetical protein